MSFSPGANQLTDWIYIQGDAITENSIRIRFEEGLNSSAIQWECLESGLWTRKSDIGTVS